MIRTLVLALAVMGLIQCAPPTPPTKRPQISDACFELARHLPAPWRLGSVEPFYPWNPHILDGTPHFTARADALELGSAYAGSERPYVLAIVLNCASRPSADTPSPCEQVAEAKARMNATAIEPRTVTRSGMRVENFRYFTSVDDNFFGMCDGAGLAEISHDRSDTCRVWLANSAGQHGLYLVVPAAAFDEIPTIVSKASFLMSEPFRVCT